MQDGCGGVLVWNESAGKLERRCFVADLGLEEVLSRIVYADGKRPLQMTDNHLVPKSLRDDPRFKDLDHRATRPVHLYCQNKQAGSLTRYKNKGIRRPSAGDGPRKRLANPTARTEQIAALRRGKQLRADIGPQ